MTDQTIDGQPPDLPPEPGPEPALEAEPEGQADAPPEPALEAEPEAGGGPTSYGGTDAEGPEADLARPRRTRLPGLAIVGAILAAAALAGFLAAAVLVPGLANASPPAGAPVSASATPTLPPTPTPSATPVPSVTPSAGSGVSPRATSLVYVVQRGDNLAAIAQKFGVSLEALAAANHIGDPNYITVGQRLIIPPPAPSPSPS